MPTSILMPALSLTMEEGTLARWHVAKGDRINPGDVIAEVETDKATMELEAAEGGTIGQLLVPEGTEGVRVNAPIATLLAEGEQADDPAPVASPASTPSPSAPAPEPAASETRVLASPLARRMARDSEIDLGTISGSGPHGRIVKADVEAHPVTQPAPVAAPQATPTSTPVAAPPAAFTDRPSEEMPLDGMRKTIAARLTAAKQTIPHFYLRRDVRLDELLALREQLNRDLAAQDLKLSVNDFVIRAVAKALQQCPDCNAIWAGDRILKLKRSDVSVAVAIDGGLITPVLRDADLKSLSALSREMKDLAARARDRKLMPAEYDGGSLTISNLGMMGVESFDAIINPPQSAILAVGAATRRPVVGSDGALEAATVMSLTLSVDHRMIDGALGAQLLAALVHNLEAPLMMIV